MATIELRLEIDEFHLDKELRDQPKQYYCWAKQAADAQLRLDEAKSALELTKAEIDKAIRTDPGAFDLAKITEATVAQTIIIQPGYQEAVGRLNEARHELAIVNAAVSALDHRKTALVKHVDLHGQNYFAEPRPSGRSKGVRPKTKRDQE